MAILDEIDSGLDIDALRDVSKAVNGLRAPEKSVLMITHYQARLASPPTSCALPCAAHVSNGIDGGAHVWPPCGARSLALWAASRNV